MELFDVFPKTVIFNNLITPEQSDEIKIWSDFV